MAQETTLKRLWDDSMQLGYGFSDREGQVLRPAVELFDVVETGKGPLIDYEEVDIESSEASSRDFKADIEASGSIFGIGLKAKYNQHQSVKCNCKSMTKILRCTMTYDLAQYPRNATPSLTDAASKLLSRDSAKFRDQHGDYFVAGYRRRAILEARYTFSGRSRNAVHDFSSSLDGGKGFVKGHIGFDFVSAAESSNMKCTVEWRSDGIETANLDTHPTRETVQKIFDNFKANVNPTPYSAMLQHYCMIDHRPRRSPQDSDMTELSDAILESYQLEKACRMSTMASVSAQILPDVAQVVRGVLDLRPVGSWEADLTRRRSQLAALRRRLTPWAAREALLAQAIDNAKYGMYRDWTKPGSERSWWFGACGNHIGGQAKEVLSEVESQELVCRVHGNGRVQHRDESFERPDKLVVGFLVQSHWNDGTNGPFKISEGGVDESRVKASFETKNMKGGHWSLTVWYVDRHLYSHV
ncbi:hypothetical protein LTS12_004179 [Elasticomyces elasticus]|nr:hypothetical protein LTS12_004179 [Elasticomyces elasticus]